MNVRIDTVIHKARRFLDGEATTGQTCTPDRPGPCHQLKLVWHVQTWCGIDVHVKGRPKLKQVTCIACIASAS
jgi:hypothetical protein